jgi:hypothetical protein
MRQIGLDSAAWTCAYPSDSTTHLAVKDTWIRVLPAHILQGYQVLAVVLQGSD